MAPISMAYDKYKPRRKTSNLNPIILCHGILMSKVMLCELCIHLCNETGREVFCVDLRGHGDSPRCDDFSNDLMAEDIKYFFQEHAIQKATIIAFSFSNNACLFFFQNDAHLVEKFISVEIPVFSMKQQTFGMKVAEAMVTRYSRPVALLNPECSEEEGRKIITEILVRDPLLNISRSVASLHSLDLIKSGNKFQIKSDVELISKCMSEGKLLAPMVVYKGETLCIFGELSTLSRESRRCVKNIFPNCKVVVIDGGTHEVLLEKPEEFVDEVKRFLQVEG